MFAEGHAVALHSSTRGYMLLSQAELAQTLTGAADRIESLAGTRPVPCVSAAGRMARRGTVCQNGG